MQKKDENQWLGDIYLAHHDAFINWALKQFPVLDKPSIEDVYQESIIAFAEQWRKQSYVESKGKVKSYLFAIGKYKCIHIIRKATKVGLMEPEESEEVKTAVTLPFELENEQELLIRKCLKMLDPKCQQLLRAFYYQDHSMQEIAEQMELKNENVAKVTKYRCVQKLIKFYESLSS